MKADAHHIAAQLGQAMASHQRGELAQAEALYKSILAANPHHFEALHYLGALTNRGAALLRLRRGDEALASLDRALSIRPEDPDALNVRGMVLRELNQFTAALASFDAALAARPEHPQALYNRALVLQEL